jgi:hypothetical protein
VTAQELTTAATKLRDGTANPADYSTLLANWLESWNHTDVQEDGPMAHDYRAAIDIARAINRAKAERNGTT